MEAKKSDVGLFNVDECERQALTACWGYFLEHEVEGAWAMTCVGSKLRIWACRYPQTKKKNPDDGSENYPDDYLIPVFPPGESLADIEEYVEINEHGVTALQWLDFIKKNPVPPKSILAWKPSRGSQAQTSSSADQQGNLATNPAGAIQGFAMADQLQLGESSSS